MQGLVTVCSDNTLKKLMQIILPVVQDAAGLGKLFFPPLPRYVFSGGCTQTDNGTNIGEVNHPSDMVSKAEHLRSLNWQSRE